MGQDFPGFYSPRATVVDSIAKPIGNGDLMPGLQIPGITSLQQLRASDTRYASSQQRAGAARTRR